jgi:hypothetical protein
VKGIKGVQRLAIAGLFVGLTVVVTWPQARYLASQATPHQDVYFNMWRLQWFAHALVTSPAHLFDANIFYPQLRTLAYSDAMPVEGLVAAPLIWAGLRPVLVHNLMMLGAIAGSGLAMFALARYLTGSLGASVLAGIVFAFAPYRFEHIMHMELQWAMWIPLAFLALHRTLDTGSWKYGIATGACLALQMLSSIYYGIFLATLLGFGAILFIVTDRKVPLRQAVFPLAAGAVLAAALSAAYAIPYMRVHERVGDRPENEVAMFSARPSSYLTAPPGNWLYGQAAGPRNGPERRLFPGIIPVFLAIVGLLLREPSRRSLVYLVLLALAFEASLGVGGYLYAFLSAHVQAYRGLRASARLGIFVLMFLAILAAYGYTALAEGRRAVTRAVLAGMFALGLLAEYRTTSVLVDYPNSPPPIYRLLSRLPRGVVAEFPVPRPETLPGPDAQYAYMSTFHWFPLVNGYSGIFPPSYLARLERLQRFPDTQSIAQLRQDNVLYVIVHGSSFEGTAFDKLRGRIMASGAFVELGVFNDADGPATLYRLL